MNSNKFEEVRKRRGKVSRGRLNLFQRGALLAMVLTLIFAIAFGPRLAPFLAGGVAGGTLLLTLIFRTLKTREHRKNKAVPQETSPEGEKCLDPEAISYRADVDIIGDSPEAISEQTNWVALRDSISLQPPEAIKTLEASAVKETELSPAEEFSKERVLTQIPEKITMLEEKVINLEDMLQTLNDRLADMQDRQLKLGPEIDLDLQAILTNPGEKHEISRSH